MIGEKTIQTLDDALQRDLKKELRDQGHYLTGQLERSIESKVRARGNDVSLEVTAEDYIDDLETGIPRHHIDVNDPVYIEGLTRYVRLRFGYQGKTARRAAVAIARKHRREGMPTLASYEFSKNGLRTEAIEHSYQQNEKEYDQNIDNGLSTELDQLIDKTFDKVNF